jgi:hypothetical protein
MPKWIPKKMEWFLAELIQQFTFANGDGPLVWVNKVLIKANGLEEAYEKALKRGDIYNSTFVNTDGIEVKGTFRGLHDLFLIYEDLEDGTELIYEEFEEISEEEIAAMISPKEQLAAFQCHSEDLAEPTAAMSQGEAQ